MSEENTSEIETGRNYLARMFRGEEKVETRWGVYDRHEFEQGVITDDTISAWKREKLLTHKRPVFAVARVVVGGEEREVVFRLQKTSRRLYTVDVGDIDPTGSSYGLVGERKSMVPVPQFSFERSYRKWIDGDLIPNVSAIYVLENNQDLNKDKNLVAL